MPGSIATGHPWLATGTDFDVAPLVLGVILLVDLRMTRTKIRSWMVPASLMAGLVFDDIADARGVSTLTVATIIVLTGCAFALLRLGSRGDLPPRV